MPIGNTEIDIKPKNLLERRQNENIIMGKVPANKIIV